MPFFETKDQTRLSYYDWGTGKPVVFVHGWAVGADMWEYQTLPLSEAGLRCIAYDQRGCGRSDVAGHGYDYDTLADDLASLIAHLDLNEVSLVSHSMGGGVITRYLSRHGAARIARAALVSTTTPCLMKTTDNPDGLDKSVFEGVIAQIRRDRPGYVATIAPGFFGEGLPGCSVSPEMVDWGVRLAVRATPKAAVELTYTNSGADHRADMAAFTVPTLIVHGDSEEGNPVELTGCPTAALIPGSRLLVYENAPHGLPITHQDRLNADLLEFIQG